MKHFLKTYWYIKVFLDKRGKLLLVAMFFGMLMFMSVFAILPSIPRPKKTVFIGRTGSYSLSTLPLDIQEKISRGLTTFDEKNGVVPDLSERWSVENDGKTYRFILKKNIFWQDGKLLVPEDVSYNFTDVETVKTPNEVVFTLKDPFTPFPSIVTQPIFRRVTPKILFVFPTQQIIGLGEYRITGIKYQGNRISELTLDGKKESIIYRFYLTEDRTITAFKLGEVQKIEYIGNPSDTSDWKTVTITPVVQHDQYLGLFFDTTNPMFEKDVRVALNYALEKSQGKDRAKGPIAMNSWAYNPAIKSYEQDINRAVDSLLKSIPKSQMIIELSAPPIFQTEAEMVKQQWETLGIRAEKACLTDKTIKAKDECKNLHIQVNLKLTNFIDVSNYQVMLVGQQISKDPDQYSQFHSTQNTNITHFKSPRIDKLLEDGRKETKQSERQYIYQDFQQFLVEDSPIIFLKYITTYTIERKKLF